MTNRWAYRRSQPDTDPAGALQCIRIRPDLYLRVLVTKLAERTGWQTVVENRPGALKRITSLRRFIGFTIAAFGAFLCPAPQPRGECARSVAERYPEPFTRREERYSHTAQARRSHDSAPLNMKLNPSPRAAATPPAISGATVEAPWLTLMRKPSATPR